MSYLGAMAQLPGPRWVNKANGGISRVEPLTGKAGWQRLDNEAVAIVYANRVRKRAGLPAHVAGAVQYVTPPNIQPPANYVAVDRPAVVMAEGTSRAASTIASTITPVKRVVAPTVTPSPAPRPMPRFSADVPPPVPVTPPPAQVRVDALPATAKPVAPAVKVELPTTGTVVTVPARQAVVVTTPNGATQTADATAIAAGSPVSTTAVAAASDVNWLWLAGGALALWFLARKGR